MSYILDALRRADSERERGAVPGLHTQGLPPLTGEDPVAPRASAWLWAGAAAAALLIAGFAWALLRPDAAPRAPHVAAPPLTPAPVQAPAVALAPVAPPPAAHLPAPTPRSDPVAAPIPAPALPPPLPTTVAPSGTPPIPAAIAPPLTPVLTPPRPAAGATPPVALEAPRDLAAALPSPSGGARPAAPVSRAAPNDPAPAPRIHALHELPDEVRRAIPALVVNGSVYSKNPADRFLIVNGQIVHELGSVAPDVVIESIGPRAAVLSALGHRFEISY